MRATAYFVSHLLYSIFSLNPIISYYILNATIIFRYKAASLGYTWICVHLSTFFCGCFCKKDSQDWKF